MGQGGPPGTAERDPRAGLWGPAAITQLGALLGNLGPAEQILDLGCGDGAMLRLLTPLLGPKVRYLGVDLDGESLSRGRRLAEKLSRATRFFEADIDCREADEARARLEEARGGRGNHAARTLLVAQALFGHLSHPGEVLTAWVGALPPGACVLLSEHDHLRRIRLRPDPGGDAVEGYRDAALRFQMALVRGTADAGAGQADIGGRLEELMARAGLVQVGQLSLDEDHVRDSDPGTAWVPEQGPVEHDQMVWDPLALRGGLAPEEQERYWALEQQARARRALGGAPVAFGGLCLGWGRKPA